MVTLEYKLSGNEFKLLQFLKTVSRPITLSEISRTINVNDRTLKDLINSLKSTNVLTVHKVKGINQYNINDYFLWNLENNEYKQWKKTLKKLLENERLINGN